MTMRGYTLIELIMVMVIIGVLVGIGAPALLETVNAWSFASKFQDFAVQSAITATNRMSREIRRLKDDNSISTADVSQLDFTDLSSNAISYTRNVGNVLLRNTDGLCDNVTALTFTYYDDSDVQLATPVSAANRPNIRRITVALSILAGTNTLNFRFQTRPQNLKRLNEKFK